MHLRFQYSLRSLFILMLMVSIGMSMIVERIRKAQSQKTSIDVIEQLGGLAFYNYQITKSGKIDINASSNKPSWLRNLLSDDFMEDIVEVVLYAHWHPQWEMPLSGLADPDNPQTVERIVEHLQKLHKLKTLRLVGSQFTDKWISYLSKLTMLQDLYFNNTSITDNGVKSLQELLPNCEIHVIVRKSSGSKGHS
jgi:hypothetical protein